jgi:hypothetical protein
MRTHVAALRRAWWYARHGKKRACGLQVTLKGVGLQSLLLSKAFTKKARLAVA